MRNLLFIGFTFFLSHLGFSQKFSFVEYSTAQGLPQSQVSSIDQDDLGYMWIGTLGGLAKFNGSKFQIFTKENGLFNNKITCVEHINKQLWIGHEGGVSLQSNGRFISRELGNNSINTQVTKFTLFQNRVIIATNGSGLYEWKKKALVKIPFDVEDGERVRDIVEYQGTYYLATRSGIYTTRDFKKFTPLTNTLDWSISDLLEKDGHLYVCAFQDGLKKINLRSLTIQDLALPIEFSPRNIHVTENHKIWVSSQTGLLIYNNNRWKWMNNENGLPVTDIKCVFEDDEKNIWLGTLGKGLAFFSGELFVYFNTSTGLSSDLVLNIREKGKGNYMIGTYDKGLIQYNGTFKDIPQPNSTIWSSVLSFENADWYGTETGLLVIDSKGSIKTWTAENGLFSDKITSLLKVSDKKMYIGGTGGIQYISDGKIYPIHDNLDKDIGTIREMLFFKKQLYIASDKGLYRYNNSKVERFANFAKTTYSLATDRKTLWIGTPDGLYSTDGEKVIFVNFTSLPSGRFISLLNYGQGRLYIGTNNGLYIHLPNSFNTKFLHFGIPEGVIDLETNLNSGYIDSENNFWFGTASGLVRMQYRDLKINNYTPRLNLKEVLLNHQSLELKNLNNEALKIPSTKNNLSFEFDGISLSQPENMGYQYWLEGADDNWSRVSQNSSVVFTGLSNGDYVLHARAVGIDGLVSKEIRFAFTILPPFYKTWWFITLMVIVTLFIVWRFIQSRIKKERIANEREKMEYKSKLLALEQQSLNASMNRHFIFNSLNSIQYFINTQDKFSANKFLTNFAQLIRKNLDSAGNDGSMIPLSKEMERLKLYLSLESMRFKDKFTYDITIDEVDTESILLPAMLLQPFVENSIIHGILPNEGIPGHIDIHVRNNAEFIEILIEDNGIGISQAIRKKESIQGDHKSQGMEITTRRIELIKKLLDQSFEIIGPHDRLDENRLINGTYVLLKIPNNNFETSD